MLGLMPTINSNEQQRSSFDLKEKTPRRPKNQKDSKSKSNTRTLPPIVVPNRPSNSIEAS